MEGFLKEQLQAITNNENEINSKIKSKFLIIITKSIFNGIIY